MNRQLEIAYLGIEVPDPATLAPFFGDVIGLVPGEPTADGAVTWRDDDRAQRVIVQAGPANDAVFVGFEATDAAAFDAIVARLRAAGATVTDGDDDDRAGPSGRAPRPDGRAVGRRGRDRAGPRVGATRRSRRRSCRAASSPTASGSATWCSPPPRSTSRTGSSSTASASSQSDWLEMELAPGIELEVRFFHCNARHHTVALAKAPFDLPQKLHHVMFETNERDDVGAAFDRAWATELAIPNGLGRHDNDGMFSFYVQSPAGFQVEVGHGARVITDGWDDDRRYDRISAWGHQPLRQP